MTTKQTQGRQIKRGKYVVPEKNVHYQVCEYLRRQYPTILFRSDYGAGLRMTIGQATMQKKLQNGDKWPDLMICEPRDYCLPDPQFGKDGIVIPCLNHGLFLELKKSGTKLKKKNGEWVTDHIKAQAECMNKLRAKGYKCDFAVGFDEAKRAIDEYLK